MRVLIVESTYVAGMEISAVTAQLLDGFRRSWVGWINWGRSIEKIPNTAYSHYLLERSLELRSTRSGRGSLPSLFLSGIDVERRIAYQPVRTIGKIARDVEEALLFVVKMLICQGIWILRKNKTFSGARISIWDVFVAWSANWRNYKSVLQRISEKWRRCSEFN